MIERIRLSLIPVLGVVLSLFTLSEVNYQLLNPLSELAVFAVLGLVLCFLDFPILDRWKGVAALRLVDMLLALLTVLCCSYLIWAGDALGRRAGAYTGMDIFVAVTGIALVLEATRRSIGLALPILSGFFIVYALIGHQLPDWLFPHRGYDIGRVAAQTFLRSEGVFGTALRVMFTYVYLFVVFGAFLEVSGATQFIVSFAQRMFSNRSGGAAKVAVLGSGLMGSLSGSAVANAVTTGAFTIPMMRSSGFKPHIAAGITAAAASGGALVPPVMGAGAYMMLEIVDPPVTFVQIAKAALIPAILYYLSIFLIVHFYAKKVGTDIPSPRGGNAESASKPSAMAALFSAEGAAFFGALAVLIGVLVAGKSPVFAVTASLGFIVLLILVNPKTKVAAVNRRITWCLVPVLWIAIKFGISSISEQPISWSNAGVFALTGLLISGLANREWRPMVVAALVKSAKSGVALVSASACVGIVIGVVTLTGVGTAFPNAIIPLAKESLFLALFAIMVCSIVLGMGLPSAVCYLLMATLIGPVLNKLGVPALAAHLFIFYFGMMSMVTPPVALAAYATASIAGSNIMETGLAAFRFSLVGFTLPFMFVYRPELLLLATAGHDLILTNVVWAVAAAIVGIISLAGGIAGYLFSPVSIIPRMALYLAAFLALFPDQRIEFGGLRLAVFDIAGLIILIVVGVMNWRKTERDRNQLRVVNP
ncbi:MAG: TRAP transporter fused permease subunit [Verrucomicrobia bacterium]|nr:TRAP transporter fused permease subunit [Verrucomicrobiota bacterium]